MGVGVGGGSGLRMGRTRDPCSDGNVLHLHHQCQHPGRDVVLETGKMFPLGKGCMGSQILYYFITTCGSTIISKRLIKKEK